MQGVVEMFNYNELKAVNIIKENERQTITLVADSNGRRYIKRCMDGDKREIYKTLQKITNPNIPRIYYVGFEDGTVVVEEYIEGITLRELMNRKIKLSSKGAAHIIKEILNAVEVLHNYNIIHRDIKPDNIILDRNNNVRLVDFDIARIYRREVRRDTEMMGSFGYAPIEQFGMMPTDFKTDIYAVGVTIKEVLNYAGVKGAPAKVAEKCTRLDPRQRYNNIAELKRGLIAERLKIPVVIAAILIVAVAAVLLMQGATESGDEQFIGFEAGEVEEEYSKYDMFSNVAIFFIDQEWEHLLFLDDMTKTGKIKLGEKETAVNAEMTLDDGALSVKLKDKKGNDFEHTFKYGRNTRDGREGEWRRNADIICRDLDNDNIPELLIGLNDGIIGTIGKQVYNDFDYCVAWCIKYNEKDGFTLCDGVMFTEKYAFYLNSQVSKVNVNWENFGDITGYILDGDVIKAVY